MKFRQWILRIHLYGGLICFWYLLIFAASSLHFHHDFDFMKEKQVSTEVRQLIVPKEFPASDSAYATTLQKELGLAGWYLPWETYRDSAGIFHTEVQNPKATYRLGHDPLSSMVSVTREYKGFWNVVNALHGFAGVMPNAPLVILWRFFTYVCLVVVIFSIISGIWLWTKKREDKAVGWAIALGIMSLSASMILIVYFKG